MTARVTGDLQFPCVATAVITPADVKDWAAVLKLLTIPDDALLLWGYIHVITAFDDSSTLTIDIGEDNDPDRFTNTAPVDLKTAAVTALDDVGGVQFTQIGEVRATFAAAGADAEVGKAAIYIAYVRPDSAHGVG